MANKKAVVVGAGLVGSLWAILLGKRGYQVEVFERRPDMRRSEFSGGRSINLAMSTRGWKAMEQAGIFEQIRAEAIPMAGRMMHSTDGELTFQPYGKKDEAIFSISRGGLNEALMNLADEYDNVRLHFHKKCRKVDLENNRISFVDTLHNEELSIESPLIFGADGAFSAVRSAMQRTSRFNYSQQYLEHGYKELTIPPTADGGYRLDKNALHIWPRGQFMLIALPNLDGSFTCTLFLPFQGEESFEQLQSDEQILNFFTRYFGDAVPLMPDLIEDFRENPTSSLVTIRCNPWQYQEKVLLLGDASHAIVPFYGQGMNSGFEDCTILDQLVDQYQEDWPTIIQAFNTTRPKDANAIAELALRNFIEMRDLVGDPMFLLRKKIEKHLHQKYPNEFLPLYSMVTFSHIPYSEALAEGQAQDKLFDNILAIDNIEQNWNSAEVDQLFHQWHHAKANQS